MRGPWRSRSSTPPTPRSGSRWTLAMTWPTRLVSAAAALAASRRNSVMGVVGPMTSSGVQAALPVLEGGRLSMVSQSATNEIAGSAGIRGLPPDRPLRPPKVLPWPDLWPSTSRLPGGFIVDDDSDSRDLADQVEQALHGTYQFAPDQVAAPASTRTIRTSRTCPPGEGLRPGRLRRLHSFGPSIRRHRQADGADGVRGPTRRGRRHE